SLRATRPTEPLPVWGPNMRCPRGARRKTHKQQQTHLLAPRAPNPARATRWKRRRLRGTVKRRRVPPPETRERLPQRTTAPRATRLGPLGEATKAGTQPVTRARPAAPQRRRVTIHRRTQTRR